VKVYPEALLHKEQSVGYPARTPFRSKAVAKGQRKSNKEIRKPKKAAATSAPIGLALRDPVQAAIKKAVG
jgi:hypothetical protein